MRFIKHTVLISTFALLTACTGAPAKLGSTTAEAPRDIDFAKGRSINAEACGLQLLIFIPIEVNDRMQRANHQLMDQAHGDYISDVKVTERWNYAVIGTVYCTQLSAMAYPKK